MEYNDLDTAYAIFLNNFVEVSEIDKEKSTNTEDSFIRKDLFEKLSDEAKEVVDIIFNSPKEIYEIIINPRLKRPSKEKIKWFLYEYWGHKKGSTKIIKKTIKELTEYTNKL